MVHASLFSGIGGPEVAAAMLGWDNAFHCEINPFGRAILEYWFPDSQSYEDITKTNFSKWRGRVDVLTGGFPCQPFSYAGKRGGREDERYLWPQMLRVIQEVRPTWVIGENVAGITTMVEGGLLSNLGEEAALFGEGDGIHRYELRQPFTIERICSDLEHIGYSVQPLLIPAAAVGAPHRRDRVFIIAHVADANSRDDLRGTGEDEGKGEGEGVQEWHPIWIAGEPGELRSEDFKIVTNTSDVLCDGSLVGYGCESGGESASEPRNGGRTDVPSSNTNCGRSGEVSVEIHTGFPDGDEPLCDGSKRSFTDSKCEGLERKYQSGDCEGGERMRVWGNSARYDWAADPRLLPEYRWKNFPAVSPVHRGNDGIPIRMDDLSISFSKWRTESLKAYGNAIVPQVMYRIFQAIESINNQPNHER